MAATATPRRGKPYIWVTWLSQMLGGRQCFYSPWFKAHYQYQKFEEQAMDLVRWNREHNVLVAKRKKQLEADGWSVAVEEQNAFKLEGESAVVAGKPDLVATKDGRVLVVDGKTGREKDSDVWQVFIYLFAFLKARPDVQGVIEGEVHYKNSEVSLAGSELTEQRVADIVHVVKIIAADTPPQKVPSRDECKRCNIGIGDCPQKVTEARATTAVGEW